MNKSQKIFDILKRKRLIGLLTPKNVEQCLIAYETLNPLGVVLEIAFRSEAASDGITAVLQQYPDALILAGTVMTAKLAEMAIMRKSNAYFINRTLLCTFLGGSYAFIFNRLSNR